MELYSTKLYINYNKMLKHEGLETVVIAIVMMVYAKQAINAINADKHVLYEKPLNTSMEIVCSHLPPSTPPYQSL